MLTTAQVCQAHHVSKKVVYDMVARGELAYTKKPGATTGYLFAEDEIERVFKIRGAPCALGGVRLEELRRMVPQVSYRQIDHWSRTHILGFHSHSEATGGNAVIEGDPGSGFYRCWPMSEVELAQRIVRLMGIGVDLETARSIASDVVAARKAWTVVGDIVKALEETP